MACSALNPGGGKDSDDVELDVECSVAYPRVWGTKRARAVTCEGRPRALNRRFAVDAAPNALLVRRVRAVFYEIKQLAIEQTYVKRIEKSAKTLRFDDK